MQQMPRPSEWECDCRCEQQALRGSGKAGGDLVFAIGVRDSAAYGLGEWTLLLLLGLNLGCLSLVGP